LDVHGAAVGFVVRVAQRQQVKGFRGPAVFGEGGAQGCGVSVAAEHPQQLVAGDGSGVQ
jgi:hypothetical protein